MYLSPCHFIANTSMYIINVINKHGMNKSMYTFFFELVCSKLNKVHDNDNNSFSPKNAFWAIFPESATYACV